MIRRPPRSTQSRSSAASDVYKRQLSGTIPHQTSALSALRSLRLGWTSLSGTIPDGFSSLSSMDAFSLSENRLSGTVPLPLCDVEMCELESNTFECPKDKHAFDKCARRCKGTCSPPSTQMAAHTVMDAHQPQSLGHSDGTNGGTVAFWVLLMMAAGVGLMLAVSSYWRSQPGDVVEAQQLKPMSTGSSYSTCPQVEETA
eukprot:TRINITY_DN22925_c0_g1_i1.p1 TRINITY_DN22925_c0_g1~~TRINITY_DN22925_c0_g1_i1.p1  ORF type:complete len:200 (-),score=71.87 TRINITY_DN22925_c0_g1_i1:102-701(-)